jgi:lauroyl/myristoyl acyltransferase
MIDERMNLAETSPASEAGAKSVRPRQAEREGARPGFWESISFTVVHTTVSLLLTVMGLSGVYRLGRAFGTLEWLVNRNRRRRFLAALDHISEVPPTLAQRRTACRKYFTQTRCDKMFYLLFDRIPRETARELLIIHNESLLQTAVARGRGVYGALSHHGPHHVIGLLMPLRGYNIAGVRDRQEGGLRRFVQDRLDRLYPEFRRTRFLYADSFEDGYIVASAMDVSRVRSDKQRKEEITIFGERRAFVSGPLRIALRCGATVLQAFILARDDFRYEVHFVDTLVDPDDVSDEDESVRRALETYARNVERYVRAYPSQMTRL